MDIKKFWDAVLRQDANEIRQYFSPSAYVNWHCTNEHFTVEEFIQANCEYPGQWDGAVERMEEIGDLIVTATKVHSKDSGASFHVVSFFKTENGKIAAVDEYWGDDGAAPQWRRDMQIGTPI